jgi:hypothetical protein
MRRVSLAFLLLASVSLSAQDSAGGTPRLSPTPANGLLRASRIAVTTAYVHNISLCQSYDHYVHEIPRSRDEDSYMRETPGVRKSAPPKNIQEKITLGRK